MANIDYDDHYEWLCEKAKIREGLAQEWLRETIAAGDVGKRFAGFEEALAKAIDAKYYQEIDDYMEAITEWQEEYGL